MQAIQTKYFGPSNSRGSRVKATAAAGSVTLAWDDSLNSDENHECAAQALRDKFDWNADGYGHLVSGCLADGSWVHVMTGHDGKGV